VKAAPTPSTNSSPDAASANGSSKEDVVIRAWKDTGTCDQTTTKDANV
jgi:hypothetical protein